MIKLKNEHIRLVLPDLKAIIYSQFSVTAFHGPISNFKIAFRVGRFGERQIRQKRLKEAWIIEKRKMY